MTSDLEGHAAPATAGVESGYAELWPGLVRLGHLLTGSEAMGQDLAQDAYLGLLRAGRVDAPQAYLRRSIVNLATNARRRAVRERRYFSSLPDGTVDPPTSDIVWPLVVGLPPRQRAVIVLRFYVDLSEAEIARVMACRPGTVKSQTSKALATLRKRLES